MLFGTMLISSTFNICEHCGLERSKKVHKKCSRILQKKHDPKLWEKINKQVRKEDLAKSMARSLHMRIVGGRTSDK